MRNKRCAVQNQGITLNSSSKPKGYLFQTRKLWEELIVQRKEKATKPKEEVSLNFLFLKRVK